MGSHTSDTATRAALDAFRHIVSLLRESSGEAERRFGLSSAQLFVLQTLADESALSINELAARTMTHQSSVSVVARKLVDRGLVGRKTSPEDARLRVLSITKAGRALLKQAPRTAQDSLIVGIQKLRAEERAELGKTLSRLARLMGAPRRAPGMFFENGKKRRGDATKR